MLWLSLRRVQLRKLLLLCGFTMFHSVFWLLFFSLLFCRRSCWSSWGCHPKNLEELEMLWLSLWRMLPSFPFLPSLLPFFLPSFPTSFLPSFIPSVLPSMLPSFPPFWIYFSWCKFVFFLIQSEFFLAPLLLDIGSSKKWLLSQWFFVS